MNMILKPINTHLLFTFTKHNSTFLNSLYVLIWSLGRNGDHAVHNFRLIGSKKSHLQSD